MRSSGRMEEAFRVLERGERPVKHGAGSHVISVWFDAVMHCSK